MRSTCFLFLSSIALAGLTVGSLAFPFNLAAQSSKPAPTSASASETVSLPEFRVETNRDNSYLATETTSGTRTVASNCSCAAKLLFLP